MTGIFTKYAIKLLVSLGITITLIILSSSDSSNAKLQALDLQNYFEDVDTEKYDVDYEDSFTVSEEVDTEDGIIENHAGEFEYMEGTASHYADKFHGRLTANGENFDMYGFTCANKKLAFGTILKVTEKKNGKSVLVRVNDRGPYVGDRIIDLSYGAAEYIGNLGLPEIKVKYFDPNDYKMELSSGKKYYLAFSEYRELLCVEENSIKILDKTSDFNKAMKIYHSVVEEKGKKSVYLFTDLKEKYNKRDKFYIGYVNSDVMLAMK